MPKLTKDNMSEQVATILDSVNTKVDKVQGKGLSTEDFTTPDRLKLDAIASNANNYSLPTASSSTLGGVKTGTNITNSSGLISVPSASTSVAGVTKLSDSVTTTSSTVAASSTAVKSVNDKVSTLQTSLSAMTNGASEAFDTLLEIGNAITSGSDAHAALVGVVASKASNDVATTTTDGLMSSTDKSKLNKVAENANNYTLPAATSSALGGVKTGTNVSITDGVISVPAASTTTSGAVKLSASLTSTSTSLAATASAVKTAYDLANTANSLAVLNSLYGVVTTTNDGYMSADDKKKLDSIDVNNIGSGNYTLPTATASVLGGVKTGTNITNTSGVISVPAASTSTAGVTKLSDSTSTTSSTIAATSTAVKAAYSLADSAKSLADSKASTDVATTTANGLMSSTDKSKLDSVASNANNYSLPTATASVLGGVKTGTNITNTSGVISVAAASTSTAGVTKLSDSTSTTSSTVAATSTAVKTVGDKVTTLENKLNTMTNGASEAFDTLLEIGNAITSGSDAHTALVGVVANKASTDVATTSAKGLMSSTDKSKLDAIASNANNYSLPTASSSTLGGVKTGTNITNTSGVISVADASTSAVGVVKLSSSTSSTSTTLAATASAVKAAYDLAYSASQAASSGASTSVATTTANGLMSSTDKKKLDSINVNNGFLKLSNGTNNFMLKMDSTGLYLEQI